MTSPDNATPYERLDDAIRQHATVLEGVRTLDSAHDALTLVLASGESLQAELRRAAIDAQELGSANLFLESDEAQALFLHLRRDGRFESIRSKLAASIATRACAVGRSA